MSGVSDTKSKILCQETGNQPNKCKKVHHPTSCSRSLLSFLSFSPVISYSPASRSFSSPSFLYKIVFLHFFPPLHLLLSSLYPIVKKDHLYSMPDLLPWLQRTTKRVGSLLYGQLAPQLPNQTLGSVGNSVLNQDLQCLLCRILQEIFHTDIKTD